MIKNVYPSAEECKIRNHIECAEKGCNTVFKCDSNLTLHLIKTHGKTELEYEGVKQYHCPEIKCIYHKTKFLKNMKYLRQHYLKTHTKKDFKCSSCQKGFASLKLLQNHLTYCGVDFNCCDCKASYASYETLQTHGRRKKHTILGKKDYKLMKTATAKIALKKHEKLLLTKPYDIFIISNITSPKSNQCEDCCLDKINDKIISENSLPNKASQKTQTMYIPTVYSVGIQTDETYNYTEIVPLMKNYIEAETQTGISLLDINEPEANYRITNSSSTQTCAVLNEMLEKMTNTQNSNSNTFIGDSTFSNGINSFEFDNCHMETQTDFIFDDVIFNTDYLMSSNMHTQTCDDLFNQFNFNDIETQTVFNDDMLRSVESQTFMSAKNNYGCKETQTDVEFIQMLEEINS